MRGAGQGAELGGLTSHHVYKHKDGALQILGINVTLLLAVLLISVILGVAVRMWLGLSFGVLAITLSFALFSGRPQHWVAYGLIYLYRNRTVLSPGASTSGIWEDRLRVLERLYEGS